VTRTPVLIALLCAAAGAQVRFEDILKGPGENWLTYSGSYSGWRYAPGRQVTPQNAGSLVPKWMYHVPDARSMQTTPIVYQGVMYVTNGNNVYALDARAGRLIWKYSDARAGRQGTNRGVGILGDRIYFTSADNYLTALDRRSGAVIFSKSFGSVAGGVTSTAPVFIAKDKIVIGTSGGDSGIRGSVAALSASTGEELWRTYTIPAKGEPGSETWGGFLEWGGAGTWLSGTYDADLNTVYWTTGNAWPDFNGVWREGDNLYTSSLIALDLDTGKMKWHFQFTPHDTHDWDAQSWPVLLDLEWQGKPRKVVVHANRNGFFYMLDRTTGEFLRATKLIDNVTWASGIDAKGRPIKVPGKDPTPAGNWVCPSVKGATNWMSQTYNPGTGLLYVITLEQCGMYTSSAQHPVPNKHFSGGGATEDGGQVLLRAVDPKTGERAWEYPMTGTGSMWAGAVSNAGGVVFAGDDDGNVLALDARTGKHVWNFDVGERLTASPIVYELDGKQYLAIASATAILNFGLFEPVKPVPLPKIVTQK
jgi:alcohol dehydrogenase (cytochrome c)